MPSKDPSVPISEFKATCLRLLEAVASEGKSIIVTKRGRPIAKVSPIESIRVPIRGSWKDQVKIKGDIVHFSVEDEWESAS
jgi:prevent-host-death family protein